MKYLRITNAGEMNINALTLMGGSTKRELIGDDEALNEHILDNLAIQVINNAGKL